MFKSVIIVLVLMCSVVSAQDFGGGILVGFLGSQVDGDELGGYDQGGLTAGGFVTRKFANNWGGRMELRYIGKGSASKPKEKHYRLRENYMEIPLLATYEFMPDWQAEFGIAIGYLLSTQEEDERGLADNKYWDDFNEYDFSLLAGVAYDINDDLRVSARFSMSVVPVRDIIGDDITGVTSWPFNDLGNQYNRTLELTLQWFWKRARIR